MDINDIHIDQDDYNLLLEDIDFNELKAIVGLNSFVESSIIGFETQIENYDSSNNISSSTENTNDYASQISAISETSFSNFDQDSILGDIQNPDLISSHQYLSFKKRELYIQAFLCDQNLNTIDSVQFKIEADKGFSYSSAFNAYICQRKNHFQISVQILINAPARYLRYSNKFFEIDHYQLNIYGIKCESPMEKVEIKQSDLVDRRHFKYEPIVIKSLEPIQMNRIIAKRLHFASTTKNNKYIDDKPNPMQRFFLLIIEFQAISKCNELFLIHAVESDKIIVRAKKLNES